MARPAPCPCTSGRPYDACCAPYHRGEREAPDPATLMRSRYAAFARGDAEYLYRTLHRDHEDRARPRDEVLASIRRAAREHRYTGLRVLDTRPADHEGVARVLFLARVFERGRDRSFAEVSDFLHDGTGWRYLCGHPRPASELGPNPEALTIDTFESG